MFSDNYVARIRRRAGHKRAERESEKREKKEEKMLRRRVAKRGARLARIRVGLSLSFVIRLIVNFARAVNDFLSTLNCKTLIIHIHVNPHELPPGITR